MLDKFYTSLKQRHYCHCFKETFCEMRKSIPSICAHSHTHVQGTFIHTKADRLCTIPPKWNPNRFLLILPAKVPHDCPTPALQRLHNSHLFRHVLRQDRRTPMQSACKIFLAHSQPTWQCGFTIGQRKMPGLAINPNILSWEFTIPKPTEQPGFSGHLSRKWGWEVGKAS